MLVKGATGIRTGNVKQTTTVCYSGRECQTERGMKIHRTNKGCFEPLSNASSHRLCVKRFRRSLVQESTPVPPDLSAGSTPKIKPRKIKWPKMNAAFAWQVLSVVLLTVLGCSLRGSIEHQLISLGYIVYEVCQEHFGNEDERAPRHRQASRTQARREFEMRADESEKIVESNSGSINMRPRGYQCKLPDETSHKTE